MSSQHRGFLVSLFIHTIFISLIYVWFDASSSINKPLLIDLTFLGSVNELPGPMVPEDGGRRLKKDAEAYQVHAARTVTANQMSRPGKPISKPKTVQKTQDPEKNAKAAAPQLQSTIEPEGMVPMASPHADASTLSVALPLQAAISGGDILSDAGPGGGGNSVQGSGLGAGEGAGSKGGFLKKYLEEHFAYVKDIIQENIIYPERARRMGWQGKVIVSFIVLENGCASNIKIKESSGHRLLDDNVIKTVKAVSPFPRPPVKSELLVPIVYRLEGT